MEIRFSCSNCSQHIAAEDSMIGQALRCPTCQAVLTVPPTSTIAPAIPDIVFRCPHCAQRLAAPPAGAGLTIQCPACKGHVIVPQFSTEPPRDESRTARKPPTWALILAGVCVVTISACLIAFTVLLKHSPARTSGPIVASDEQPPQPSPATNAPLPTTTAVVATNAAAPEAPTNTPPATTAPEIATTVAPADATPPTPPPAAAAPPLDLSKFAQLPAPTWKLDGFAVTALAISPDARLIAGCCGDGSVRVWDAANGKELQNHRLDATVFHCVAFSPDNHTLVAGSDNGLIQFWTTDTGADGTKFEIDHDSVIGALFSATGQSLVTLHARENARPAFAVRTWDLKENKLRAGLLPQTDGYSLSLARTTGLIYIGHGDGIAVLNADSGELLNQLDGAGHVGFDACGIAATTDGTKLVAAQQWGRATVFDPRTLKSTGGFTIGECRFRLDTPQTMTFSPDGTLLACGTGGDTAYLWNASDWKLIQAIPTNAACVAFSADGRLLINAGTRGIELRDLKSILTTAAH